MSSLAPDGPQRAPNGDLTRLLRCPRCGSGSSLVDHADGLVCTLCADRYPVTDGVARLLVSDISEMKRRTAESFGFEWRTFHALRPEWERNFLDYMRPHRPSDLAGKVVLDAGSGSGRHSYYAAKYGAQVVALDIGDAIDVTRENTRDVGSVLAVQGDIEAPPLREASFDLVYSLGVIHHLTDPGAAMRALVNLVRPGGEVRVYVYSDLRENRLKRFLLPAVTALRQLTVRLPHRALYGLSFPITAVAWLLFVVPARMLRRSRRTRAFAEALPLAAYVDYPFGVAVNDQFDRFSAPLERRYAREEVMEMLRRAGLEDVRSYSHYGWVAYGRRPAQA